jgi:type III pantothenate kinase
MEASREWLALMIGNSHLHWAYFEQDILIKTWQTNHLDRPLNLSILRDFLLIIPPKVGGLGGQKYTVNQDSPLNPYFDRFYSERVELLSPSPILGDLQTTDFPANTSLYLASVVPEQTKLFLDYPHLKLIKLADIPLKNLYPSLGIDRALAVLGSGETDGFPSLVIDGGTALTLTGVNYNQELVGGAILPGLSLQFQSLATKTAALPALKFPQTLPTRWAMNTEDAIASGILYTVLSGLVSFIEDWLGQFPKSNVILTGGDGERLLRYLQQIYPDLANYCKFDSHLIFWGTRSLKNQ